MTTQLSLKLPADLKQSLEADAQMLGISISFGAASSSHRPRAVHAGRRKRSTNGFRAREAEPLKAFSD